ncbi:hypothetical protein D9611_001212 [Ephemerocybe angulata]|uniref:F-box domain-containing protein n=1 Tax=Ephemerocybe angulata TaxID=980116 RepID=A0A8H5FLU0_9AGAR|nr:hypothetical protein D9611_001212 [Tulosesus angulatus]
MKKLPIELQTDIVKELPTRDICRLQQTCKAFYYLIEGNSEVWRECLRRQCGADVLWSSFSGFTASELRRACTGTLRFKHRYRRGNHPTPPIPRFLPYNCENGGLESQQSENSNNPSYPGMNSTFLVPGGRFLITVEQKWLRVWDLGPPGVLHEPQGVIFYELNCANMDPWIADAVVAGKDTVHLLIQEVHSPTTLPQSFTTIDHSEYNIDDQSRFSLFHRYEIHLRDGGQYSVQELGRLCVLHSSGSEICATQDGPIVAFAIEGRVLIWGASDSPGKSWVASTTTTSEDIIVKGVFCHQGYVFVVYSDGLMKGFGLAGITPHPLGNGLVDLPDRAPDIGNIPPSLLFQPFPESNWASNFMLHEPVAKGGPLYYDIRHSLREMDEDQQHLVSNPYYVRFCFSFHPESPSASSLLPTKKYKATVRPYYSPRLRFELDEGVGGYILFGNRLGNQGNMYISINDNPDSDSPNPTGSIIEDLGYFAEMIARPDPEPIQILNISICPLSGRVVALWGRESREDRFVKIFDLYDCSSTT